MIDSEGKLHFYLNDHLGSARMVIDTTGTVKDNYDYYAFGEALNQTVSTGQSYGYTGKPFDNDHSLNLHYYGARYYDGTTGRFISVDPSARKYPAWSPYVYVLGNPLKYTDPDGRLPSFLKSIAKWLIKSLPSRAVRKVLHKVLDIPTNPTEIITDPTELNRGADLDNNGNGIADYEEDLDGDGIPEYLEDNNNDGIPDGLQDSDGDGFNDYWDPVDDRDSSGTDDSDSANEPPSDSVSNAENDRAKGAEDCFRSSMAL